MYGADTGLLVLEYANGEQPMHIFRSIHYDLREADIIALFATFGKITKSEMAIDPATQRSKGFCFIEFEDPASAEACMVMNGFELAGRKIKVGRPNQGASAAGAAAAPVPPTLMVPPPPTLTVPVVAVSRLNSVYFVIDVMPGLCMFHLLINAVVGKKC